MLSQLAAHAFQERLLDLLLVLCLHLLELLSAFLLSLLDSLPQLLLLLLLLLGELLTEGAVELLKLFQQFGFFLLTAAALNLLLDQASVLLNLPPLDFILRVQLGKQGLHLLLVVHLRHTHRLVTILRFGDDRLLPFLIENDLHSGFFVLDRVDQVLDLLHIVIDLGVNLHRVFIQQVFLLLPLLLDFPNPVLLPLPQFLLKLI